MGTEHLTMEREAGAYAHQLSTAMGHFERAWHEERGLAAVRRSDHQYDCQHGQGKAYQYGNTTAYLQSIELWNFECDIPAPSFQYRWHYLKKYRIYLNLSL